MDLILDIKISIACLFEDVFYKMTIADLEFRTYSRTPEGCALFVRLFSMTKNFNGWGLFHYLFERLHRGGDLPSVISIEGKSFSWYYNGMRHRDGDQPAVESSHTKMWVKYGKIHRDNDLPAFISSSGEQNWYQNDILHRDGDNPAVITKSCRVWYKNGLRHRDNDLPAIITYGNDQQIESQYWYKNNKKHRDNGLPAVVKQYRKKWYINGKLYRKEAKIEDMWIEVSLST